MYKTLTYITIITITSQKWDIPEDKNVGILTQDTFHNFIQKHSKVFVKFYAPWCGHCKAMAPSYSKLAEKMNKEENGIPITKVDATIEKELAEKYEIKGFPSLKLFINGEPVNYDGQREEKEIYDWIQSKSHPSSFLISNQEDLKEHSEKKLSVLFFLPEENLEMLKKYKAIAFQFDDIPFSHCFDENLKKSEKIDKQFGFVVYRNFDEGKKVLQSDQLEGMEGFVEFLKGVRFPIVMKFDQISAERIFGSQSPAVIYFSDEVDEKYEIFRQFAKNNQKQILFAHSTITFDLGEKLSEFIGIGKENQGEVRILNFEGENLRKYKIYGNSVSDLQSQFEKYNDKKLQPYFKSEPIPQINTEPVKVVVGETFEEMILKSDKFVLMEAYAPWCGHCKKLEPIYKELAENLEKIIEIDLVKFNAVANEHPSLQITGFPSIKLYFPGGEVVDYEGDRSYNDLVNFLQEQTKLDLDIVKTEEL